MTNLLSMTKEEQAAAVALISPMEIDIVAAQLYASLTLEERKEALGFMYSMAKEEVHG